jgi:ubiquinone/menaquinone biosynthesis C-methylase UbiE
VNTSPREAYDEWHKTLEVDREANAPWHELVRAHLDPPRDLAGKELLEIGCGRGGLTAWLASRQYAAGRLVAVDVSGVAVNKGRAFAAERGLGSIDWMVGDIHHLGFRSATFDTVVSCETVEHLNDPQRALLELARVLKRGGRLFLTTPNYLGTMGLYRLYLRLTGRRFTEVGQSINRLTMWPRTVRWLFRAGLRLVVADGVGHYLLRRGRTPVRLTALDRARAITRWVALHTLVVAEKR